MTIFVDQDGHMLERIGIAIDEQQLEDLCRRYHIARLWLFGSVLRDDFGPHSDVDVLVEFQPGQAPGLEFVDLQMELEQLFGRSVDLLTAASLRNPYRRAEILRTRRLAYAA